MTKEYNILISSVGGQGGITLSRILSNAALIQGLNVRIGETLGMAQRGGAVQSHVRVGTSVYGSLIRKGGADVLIALEPSEAVRVSKYLRKGTRVIMNTEPTYPIPVMLGDVKYPEIDEVSGALEKIGCTVYKLNASKLANKADAPRSLNVVALGAYMALGEYIFESEAVESAIKSSLPERYLNDNTRAYKAGYNAIKSIN
jgi:indolepyruvate ferredoxin oxidoreductase beta subunit